MMMSSSEPAALLLTQKQLRLFSLRDPLTDRFGGEYFRSLPQMPGVYFFYGALGDLLYIGQSLDLRARIGSYRHVTPEKNPKRTLKLVYRIVRIEWQTCTTAAEAVELERVLLLQHRPPYNRAGVWQGDPWWLAVQAQAGRLHLKLSRKEAPIGPLPSAFRYAFGSLLRCLYRAAHPTLSLAAFPHRLFAMQVPLTVILTLPELERYAQMITEYATGNAAEVLARVEALAGMPGLAEQGYWLEEVENVKRYASKTRHVLVLTDGLTKRAAVTDGGCPELNW